MWAGFSDTNIVITGVCGNLRHQPCYNWCVWYSQTPTLLYLICAGFSDTNIVITGVCGILRHQPCYHCCVWYSQTPSLLLPLLFYFSIETCNYKTYCVIIVCHLLTLVYKVFINTLDSLSLFFNSKDKVCKGHLAICKAKQSCKQFVCFRYRTSEFSIILAKHPTTSWGWAVPSSRQNQTCQFW